MFEEHGEIKTFFDLIANRGMVFVTYVSLRLRFCAHGKNSAPFRTVRHSGSREGQGALARVRDQWQTGESFPFGMQFTMC